MHLYTVLVFSFLAYFTLYNRELFFIFGFPWFENGVPGLAFLAFIMTAWCSLSLTESVVLCLMLIWRNSQSLLF